MIAKRIPSPKGGTGFRRLGAYILNAKGDADPASWARLGAYVLDENHEGAKVAWARAMNCGHDEPGWAVKSIISLNARNTRSQADKSYHPVVSFPEGERPTREQMEDIEDTLCEAIGFGSHMRVSAVHQNTDDGRIKLLEPDQALFDFSLEARLANHFAHFGPFIAVGSPTQKIMPIGARRFQLSDEEWQDAIQKWLDKAETIIYMAGTTYWALWELSQVIAKGFVCKLIIVFPHTGSWVRANYPESEDQRMTAIRQAFAGTIWETGLAGAGPSNSIRSISFSPSGGVLVVASRGASRTSYQFAALIAHYFMIERTAPSAPPGKTALAHLDSPGNSGSAKASSSPISLRHAQRPTFERIQANCSNRLPHSLPGLALAVSDLRLRTERGLVSAAGAASTAAEQRTAAKTRVLMLAIS